MPTSLPAHRHVADRGADPDPGCPAAAAAEPNTPAGAQGDNPYEFADHDHYIATRDHDQNYYESTGYH